MIILDTNVLSELMRGESEGDPRVFRWVRELTEQPVTTVINQAEIMAGLALLPPGRRRDRLQAAASATLDRMGICLPLAAECAGAYAEIVALRQRSGRPIGSMDALIGSIAVTSGASLATRNSGDFEGIAIPVVNPWD